MNKGEISLDSLHSSSSRFDAIIETLFAGLFVFMPLAFGAVKDWSKEVVIILSGCIVVCYLLKIVYHRQTKVIWSRAYLPVIIFLFVVTFQLFPIPVRLINIISPNTALLKTQLLGDLDKGETLLSSMTLSFYPHSTKHDLRLLLALAAVFFVVFNNFKSQAQIRRILTIIAVTGGFVAVIALAQNLFGNGKIYLFKAVQSGNALSGPFVNHSHYGQFMNLSIGAAFGLLMLTINERFGGKKITIPLVFEYLSSRSARTLWLLVAIISLGISTIFMSLTRGGMVSMLIAIIFTTLIITSRKSIKGYGWITAVIALMAFACVVYTSFDVVYNRLASLRNLAPYENRLQIVKDLTECFRHFPISGTGQGTHLVVYPMYDSSNIIALATHAENEYAQVLEETGLVGLVTLIFFGVIIWRKYAKNIRSKNLFVASLTYGLGFGLIAILIHSLSDFGQHTPSNGFLSITFCALILSLGQMDMKDKHNLRTPARVNSRSLRVSSLLIIFGILLWALGGADDARIAEASWKKVHRIEKELVEKNWEGSEDEYKQLINNAAIAVRHQPDSVHYRYWFNVYRWQQINQQTDRTWSVVGEESMPIAYEIIDDLQKACRICPTFGPTYCVLGQLEMLILDKPEGIDKINKGFQLAPCDPISCYVAGFTDVEQGRIDESVKKLTKVVHLDGKYFKDVAHIYTTKIDRPDLALSVAGNNISWLAYLSSILDDTEEHKELSEQIRTKSTKLLEERCARAEATAYDFVTLANIYNKQDENKAKAVDYYRRALALDFGRVQWRLNLAKLLAETGDIKEAIHEARICLKLRPDLKEAKRLIGELSVRKSGFSEEVQEL